tara:strand:- start:181 stop:681 length:501 start_codon:yes stop_codon:yes gene_type:complete
MNLLKSLWNWFLELIGKAPTPTLPVVEKQAADTDCCELGDCSNEKHIEEESPAPIEELIEIVVERFVEELPEEVEEILEEIKEEIVEEVTEDVVVEKSSDLSPGELLKEILLSERVSDVVLEKYKIIDTFEEWYSGACDSESVRESIQRFKEEKGGSIRSKLSKVE